MLFFTRPRLQSVVPEPLIDLFASVQMLSSRPKQASAARLGLRPYRPPANRLPDQAHDLDAPIPIFFGVDLGRPQVLMPQDDPRGLEAEPLANLGRRRVPQLM